ncbi:folate-binding protein YgfZ [Microbacterium sp. SORGH_AS_0888]|uniref:CAF17-like 4Fe-4S cluster assembly/insertion protein YgfZ n=1 Tax=Microbacterium sp. SORGH_AS_0888 TaxID=3041791 RepID=UPI00277F06FC|nr:glycine cleavage T C-terminal barrel domain-containing protein [Microbacterium sp. SORGH_AS_0888]MDQ1131067.1 folate-binding protein YgfZ [Microbacterium sp. SORGH_AS_0888]
MTGVFAGVPGVVVDDDRVQHFGNPFAEQRALVGGRAVAVLEDRAALAVTGEDRLSWLDSISSQALTGLAPGVSTELLVLDPQGRVEHAAAVIDDGVTTWLIVDRGDAAPLLEWLRRMRFRLRVDPQEASGLIVLGATDAGVHLLPAAAPAHVPLVWRDPWPQVAPGGVGYADAADHPGAERSWNEVLVTTADAEALAAAAIAGEIALAGAVAADALRVAAWRPRWAAENDERLIPHEVDWLRTAVHLDKGCYRGQETVAKVHNLGHPPRRLVALHLDGSDDVLPAPGDPVEIDGAVVGAITSVARHHEDGPIALALVKRSAGVEVDAVVRTAGGEVAASVRTVVPADAGAAASVPRLPRLSRRR